MNYASPNYAWLLFLLPAIALLKIWADARVQTALGSFASSGRLRASLLGGASLLRSGLHFGLQLLGVGFFILALTRPQLGTVERDLDQSGRSIFFAIDTSKSMLARDVLPDRLTRAKLAAQDLLEKLPGDRVGIIAFAGRAFLQAPLTTDHNAITETLQTLDHTTIPRGGSSLASAIELAVETAAKSRGVRHGLVIFTDGQETDDATLAAAKKAADMDLIILPVGMGTTDGTFIPDPDPDNEGANLRDENNKLLTTRLESGLLRQVARITGGEYVELNSQALSAPLVNRILANLNRHQDENQHLSRPIERYQWPLFAGILCIAMSLLLRPSSRRLVRAAALPVDPKATVHQHARPAQAQSSPMPMTTAQSPPQAQPPSLATRVPGSLLSVLLLLLLLLSPPSTSHAVVAPELQKARTHFKEKKFQEAKDEFSKMLQAKEPPAPLEELYYGLGASSLQLKEYDTAAKAFSDALKSHDTNMQQRSLRGLGTALYNQGDILLKTEPETTIKSWTDSRDHFDTALKQSKEGSDEYKQILENRDFVQKRLDELKKEQEAKGKGKSKQKQKDKQKGNGQGEPDDSEDGEGEEPQEKKNDGNQGEENQQKKTDAMQKDQGALPEGELRAGEAGKQSGQSQAGNADDMRNNKTGYTPQEARSQLRIYADDQKSVQYLMRRERPLGGKDY